MKADQKRELERYYHSIRKELICGGIEKRTIIGSIKDSVECFMVDHPDADIAAVIEHFGSAKEVAEEYLNNETNEVVKAKVKRSQTIVISVIVALAIVLLVYIAFIVTAIISNIKTANGYAIEYITVISESDSDGIYCSSNTIGNLPNNSSCDDSHSDPENLQYTSQKPIEAALQFHSQTKQINHTLTKVLDHIRLMNGGYVLLSYYGEGPSLVLYKYRIKDNGDCEIISSCEGVSTGSGGISVNCVEDEQRFVYFGNVSDSHWDPIDDSVLNIHINKIAFQTNKSNVVKNISENDGSEK